MPLPEPPSGESRELLQKILELTVEERNWPTFAQLERRWDFNHETEAADILCDLPEGFVCGFDRRRPTQGSAVMGLTLAGVAACDDLNSGSLVSNFETFVYMAVEFQREQSNANPIFADTELRSGLRYPLTSEELQLLGLLIRNESSLWYTMSGPTADGHWKVTLDRKIRAFRDASSRDDYWDRRDKPWESRSEPPATASQGAAKQGVNAAGDLAATPIREDNPTSMASTVQPSPDAPIFIVHGSDTLRAESVARTVTQVTGRQTIILREQASLGQTLIEKFEQHAARASYAIIVLTPDDEGGRKGQHSRNPRGRQNVILEMGYFYGVLGRSRVSILLYPGVERPSDMDGLVYINFDDDGAWKSQLFRELAHAHIQVDVSRG
jgi:predicted nucleotide-binding protein